MTDGSPRPWKRRGRGFSIEDARGKKVCEAWLAFHTSAETDEIADTIVRSANNDALIAEMVALIQKVSDKLGWQEARALLSKLQEPKA